MKPVTKGYIGARVSDGGRGAFPADIIEIGDTFVIVANSGCAGIEYQPRMAGYATHEYVSAPGRCYENKQRGFFVVPKGQLFELEHKDR